MSSFTRDNPHYRSLQPPQSVEIFDQMQLIAQKNRPTDLPSSVRELVKSSVSENSRRAYLADLRRFASHGGTLPADSSLIASYIADHADTHAVSTIRRWIASLSKAHTAAELPDPTKAELVKSTMKGISRLRGEAINHAAPLLRDDLFTILDKLGGDIQDIRDRALLLIGFSGGFRRSELVGLNYDDISFDRRGLIVTLRRSKTDQNGIGREIGIPLGTTRHCPVRAMENWLRAASIDCGPTFRSINRHGFISTVRLSGEAVSIILKKRAAAASIAPSRYSGHSLRAGFCTSAAQAGVASWKIRKQTGHASDTMLSRYIRDGELFIENALHSLL